MWALDFSDTCLGLYSDEAVTASSARTGAIP